MSFLSRHVMDSTWHNLLTVGLQKRAKYQSKNISYRHSTNHSTKYVYRTARSTGIPHPINFLRKSLFSVKPTVNKSSFWWQTTVKATLSMVRSFWLYFGDIHKGRTPPSCRTSRFSCHSCSVCDALLTCTLAGLVIKTPGANSLLIRVEACACVW